MKSQLLIETLTPGESNILEERSADGKRLFLTGICMQGGIKNRNNREYPVTEIARAVTEAMVRIKETNGIFGELDHPQTLNINMPLVSHVIRELRMEGNNAVGKLEILATPMGAIAKTLIESGVRVGVSSRGAGAVNESGHVDAFSFVTLDLVATPSAKDALPQSVYESLQQIRNGEKILTLAEQIQGDASAQKFLKKELQSWIADILNKQK